MKRTLTLLVSGLAGMILSGSAMAATMEIEQEYTQHETIAESGAWQLIHEAYVQLPSGHSYSRDYYFEPLLQADELLVLMQTASGAPCRAAATFVEMTADEDQHIYSSIYPNAEGLFPVANGTVHFLRFNNYHPGLLSTNCYRRLYARTADVIPDPDDGDDDANEEFEYLDFITYEGGFAQSGVSVENTAMLTKFWLRVPDYCVGLEVLEAGTVTEGVFDIAVRIDDDGAQIYEVNAGNGMRVSDIKATLNGPRGLSCDIPVYGVFAD